MAKKIIILRDDQKKIGLRTIGFCLWFSVPVGDEVPEPGRSSAWNDASAGEVASIQNGSVIEQVVRSEVPVAYTATELKTFAIALYDSIEAAFTTQQPATGYPGEFYGTYYDGTSWSVG